MRKRRKRTVRRVRRTVARRPAASPIRRRRRRARLMSAFGGNITSMLTQAGMALAGGVAGKALRNLMPADLSPEIKAAVTAGAGVAVGTMMKQPLIGAGIVGSAGAYYAATLGARLNIPFLSASETTYVRLAENKPQVYADQYGNTLKRIGDQFYYPNGQLTMFTPNDFQTIN